MTGSILRTVRKIGGVKAQINFLTHYSKINIVPNGFRFKSNISMKKADQLED